MKNNFYQAYQFADFFARMRPTPEQLESARRAGEEMRKTAGRIGFEVVRAAGLSAAVVHNIRQG